MSPVVSQISEISAKNSSFQRQLNYVLALSKMFWLAKQKIILVLTELNVSADSNFFQHFRCCEGQPGPALRCT